MDSEKKTRYWLMFFIVLSIGIFSVIFINTESNKNCDPSSKSGADNATPRAKIDPPIKMGTVKNEFLEQLSQGLTVVTNVAKEPNQTRFRYEYRLWPQREFTDDDNYGFYSMYGWRTPSSPYQYPQKTIDTAYDRVMRDCNCFPSEGNEDCLGKCRFNALRAAGFPSVFDR